MTIGEWVSGTTISSELVSVKLLGQNHRCPAYVYPETITCLPERQLLASVNMSS